jgi:hypothetical protein
MGVLSRTIDKSPQWIRVLVYILAVPLAVYCITHYGFWSFLLHFIFSPTL